MTQKAKGTNSAAKKAEEPPTTDEEELSYRDSPESDVYSELSPSFWEAAVALAEAPPNLASQATTAAVEPNHAPALAPGEDGELQIVSMPEEEAGKWYVVSRGRKVGLFKSSMEANEQVLGYPNGTLRAYPNYQQALSAWTCLQAARAAALAPQPAPNPLPNVLGGSGVPRDGHKTRAPQSSVNQVLQPSSANEVPRPFWVVIIGADPSVYETLALAHDTCGDNLQCMIVSEPTRAAANQRFVTEFMSGVILSQYIL
ncbi:hypothetical protein BDN72DRAFT_906754 [Pluteus cervinus]|uniref:Uncharacterized protein n=1 Tax=Pluteus cervinus TaxID=181527 RepID=A0ACD2ZYC2_9AGAR|nr:hypothetical protein BDN72DRAFT_906754 [Pluteus cervinus]